MRNIILSDRMEALVDLVSPDSGVIADVGCDHAYVSIALIKRGLSGHVIAMDVKKGPLEIAENNIADQNLEDKIELRLSDGLEKLSPGEAEGIIIAGMGGLLMVQILSKGINMLNSSEVRPYLILQPQSDFETVRIFLHDIEYHIVQEKMIFEDGKYYTAIKAVSGKEESPYKREELIYGRDNLKRQDGLLFDYLKKESEELDKIEGQLKAASKKAALSDRGVERIGQVQEKKRLNLLARQYYGEVHNEM